jgi:prepilin-type N-terminal cleavage/methylation domain-containing protein
MQKNRQKKTPAFSLIEMLVVIAVIGILTALAVPAFRGLVGTSGVRGGADTLLGALDQTRAIALEKGITAYLAFPANTFSRFIILTENGTTPTVISPRWFKLPTGVQLSPSNITFTSLPTTALPQIDGSNAATPLRAIRYNRFGSIHGGAKNWSFSVGEGFADGTNVTLTDSTNSRAVFTAQPLVGKWTPSTNN